MGFEDPVALTKKQPSAKFSGRRGNAGLLLFDKLV